MDTYVASSVRDNGGRNNIVKSKFFKMHQKAYKNILERRHAVHIAHIPACTTDPQVQTQAACVATGPAVFEKFLENQLEDSCREPEDSGGGTMMKVMKKTKKAAAPAAPQAMKATKKLFPAFAGAIRLRRQVPDMKAGVSILELC